ncbi:PREDICTED: uncharacterized protein LOC104827160 [Tarenaya hassleriana]|uniref:uncharacterized protein LOC104827160 n=1 Tax=Tarenaya hassleriana TaxID=28532 RepID=UPI00053C2601|nr:PREDICTED: uncharacterized protein LOC104827160 [Tarenaya hassleriana]
MPGDGETIGASDYGSVDEEAEEDRKESILASTPSLQPNFKRSSVTHQQILKLQELHKRRMQIKAKSKIQKKGKDGKRPGFKNLEGRAPEDSDSDICMKPEYSSSITVEKSDKNGGSSSGVDNKTGYRPPKKLHWGLEPKERWERKANM